MVRQLSRCYKCGSKNLNGDRPDVEGGFVNQMVECMDCGAYHREEYTLTGVYFVEPPPEEDTMDYKELPINGTPE